MDCGPRFCNGPWPVGASSQAKAEIPPGRSACLRSWPSCCFVWLSTLSTYSTPALPPDRLVGASAPGHGGTCLSQNLQVENEGPVLHVAQVEPSLSSRLKSDRPLTCHRPVMPGLTTSLRRTSWLYLAASEGSGGPGPTRDISPRITLNSCGSSSSDQRRSHEPVDAIRGSRRTLNNRPSPSSRARISFLRSSASGHRFGVEHTERQPVAAILVWVNSTGAGRPA